MYVRSSVKRKFNRKLRLCKQIREEYANSIEFRLPRGYEEVYVLSKEVAIEYSTIILYEQFNWVVCESHILDCDKELWRYYRKYKDMYVLFRDGVVKETTGKGVEDVKHYLEKINVDTRVKVLTLETLRELCKANLIRSEILYSEQVISKTIKSSNKSEYSIKSTEENNITNNIYDKIRRALCDDNTGYFPYTNLVSPKGHRGMLCVSQLECTWGEVVGPTGRTRVRGLNMNRAMHGDEVYVVDDKVVSIASRKIRRVVGTVHRIDFVTGNVSVGYVWPIDRRLPEIRILLCDGESLVGQKVAVRIMHWDVDQIYPFGLVCKVLGKSGDLENEVAVVMEEYDLEYDGKEWLEVLDRRREGDANGIFKNKTNSNGFSRCNNKTNSNDIINNVKSTNVSKNNINHNTNLDNLYDSQQFKLMENLGNDTIPDGLRFSTEEFSVERAREEVARGRRIDLRDLVVFTIDPPGCTDIDDALHCTIGRTGNEEWIEIGVHIADVSLFVSEGSVLDKEALHRSTSVYLPDRRIDMLPPFISSGLCSLHAGKERAAVSCVWKFSSDYKVLETKMFRSLICSRRAFSYEEAQMLIEKYNNDERDNNSINDGGNNNSMNLTYLKPLKILVEIGKKLRADRFSKGALQLNMEDGFDNSADLHYTVEEFMLLANISVAEFINTNSPACAVLRRHPLPAALDLDSIDCSSSKTINDSLIRLSSEKANIYKRIITRSMRQAIYFVNSDALDFFHYGLAVPIYTHFTSPIRRYADILVHRILCHCLDNNNAAIDAFPETITSTLMSHINWRSRNAVNISRTIDAIYNYIGASKTYYEGIIISIKETGYIFYVKDLSLEEFVASTDTYKLFDKLNLRLIKNISQYFITRKVEFEIIKNTK